MSVTVRQLAEWVRGEVLGDADLPIANARSLNDAQPGDITFVDGDRNLNAWHNSKASAAVVPFSVPVNGRPIIRVSDPLMAFADIVFQLRGRPSSHTHTVDATAAIHASVRLASGVTVGPFVTIGEGSEIGANTQLHAGVAIGRSCRIGEDSVLHPRVVLYDDCLLGDRVVIHANSVIGADGFGYRLQAGKHVKVPQLGWVEIEDDVEIGACSTVDRGTFGPTRIGAGTKIDNLVQVAHNCRIGPHNIIAAQAGLAGSATTGEYVVLAGQAGVVGHIHIGDRSVIAAQSAVTKNAPADSRMWGFPARPEGQAKRNYAVIEHLPELRADVIRMKKHLGLEDARDAG